MIRVVFDTNIVVSGLLWTGAPARAIDSALEGQIELLATEALLAELQRVLTRKKFAKRLSVIGKTPETFLANYRALVELVPPAEIPPVIRDDPKDDIVLACAVGGSANYIVSGDHHLLNIGSYNQIPIWDINRFLSHLQLA